MYKSSKPFPRIPNWIIWIQAICFSVLYAIWALPETILIRHVCLITGALLSLWTIYQYRNVFFQRSAISIWLIVALFGWATFHLFFLSNDFAAQYEEFTSIWKRTAIGAIFALGFGIALTNSSLNMKEQKSLSGLIYLGLLAPTLIYIVKFLLTHHALGHGELTLDYWKLYDLRSMPFYVPKTTYVYFCLPALAVALGLLAQNIYHSGGFKLANAAYLATIPAVLFVFHNENIKNGVVFSTTLLIFFFGTLLFYNFRSNWAIKLIFLVASLATCAIIVASSVQANNSWRTFRADAKIAIDTQAYPQWKYGDSQGLPKNELGLTVSATNYLRIAWAKKGLELVTLHPLGYGLVERSFGHLAQIYWPDTNLDQSHSGWIDLTLGLGIPGLLLIFLALFSQLYQLAKKYNATTLVGTFYPVMTLCALFSLLLMWCTTEISQKVYFDGLIFWIVLGAGMSASGDKRINNKVKPRGKSLINM